MPENMPNKILNKISKDMSDKVPKSLSDKMSIK